MKRVALHVVLILVVQCSFKTVSSVLSADVLSMYKIREHFSNNSQLGVLWVGSDPCLDEWHGVICDKATSTVVLGLQLSHMQLQGHIPKELSQLHHLQELWLDQNQLGGTIPIELGNLTNLKSLRLQGNMVEGYLPEKLRGIPDLSYDHELICTIPADAACATLKPSTTSRQAFTFLSDSNFQSAVQNGQLTAQSQETYMESYKKPRHGAEFVDAFKKERILLSQSSAPSLLIELLERGDKESWTCLCVPEGTLGIQNYSRPINSFTDCSCSSACKSCPGGQVLDLLVADNGSCDCISPLLIVVQLLNIQLSNYTLSTERNFTRNFAASIQLSPLQVIPIARRGGIVVLDIYIFPYTSSTSNQGDIKAIETLLIQKNNSNQGTLQDPILGPFSILAIKKPLESSDEPPSKLSRRGGASKFFLLGLILSVTMAAIALVAALSCFIHHKRKLKSQLSLFTFERDMSSNSSTTNLVSQISFLTQEFQVYDNSCFSAWTGCMGRASFKFGGKSEAVPGTSVRRFTYSELDEATERFSKFNVIGLGGSSSVYRGLLKDGKAVAVKKLEIQNGSDAENEFLVEVQLLSRLHHFHLVPLIGYCIESHGRGIQRLLVYEYMPNGNLRDHLDGSLGKESLNWITRVRIALGAARGLEYLHEAASPRVLHRDFKSNNILLDSKWRAKVSDFGMAKPITGNDINGWPNSPAKMLGTFGYFAPEYAMMGRASLKSDVFSFGVVLLELISGRRPVNMSLPKGQQSLVIWIPFSLPWNLNCSDYNFSREDLDLENNPMIAKQLDAHKAMDVSIFEPEINKVCSQRWTRNQTLLLGIEEILGSQGEPKLAIVKRSSSWSSAEYLRRLTSLTADDPVHRSSKEETLDLMEPRLESFWQPNGLSL